MRRVIIGDGYMIIFLLGTPQLDFLDKAMERAWDRKNEWEQIGNKAQQYIKTLIPESPETIFLDELLSII